MVYESGATSNIRTNIKDFKPTKYKWCKGIFVSMGDGREIPVLGYVISVPTLYYYDIYLV